MKDDDSLLKSILSASDDSSEWIWYENDETKYYNLAEKIYIPSLKKRRKLENGEESNSSFYEPYE